MKKKILAIILAAVLSVNLFCLSVSAATDDDASYKEFCKLFYLVQSQNGISALGDGNPYGIFQSDFDQIFDYAKNVLNDDSSTYDDYHKACEEILDLVLNRQYINYEYAYATYQNALNEKNIDGWFTDEEWRVFQDEIVKLKAALDAIEIDENDPLKYNKIQDEEKLQALTDAFHALLRSYNTMTNRNAVIGDVNGNGKVDIDDVTLIQKYLAEMCDLNGAQRMRASIYANYFTRRNYEKISVADVTQLQCFIAEFTDEIVSAEDQNYVFVSEMPTNPLVSKAYLMERTLNFNICPRNDLIFYDIENGFYAAQGFVNTLSTMCDLSIFENF